MSSFIRSDSMAVKEAHMKAFEQSKRLAIAFFKARHNPGCQRNNRYWACKHLVDARNASFAIAKLEREELTSDVPETV